MNKTIYLPDDEAETWEKARKLANDKLSPVIVKALKEFVRSKSAEGRGFERIELAFNDEDDNGLPKRKAFHGRWIFPPKKPLKYWDDDGTTGDFYCVAVTAKDNVVMYTWSEGSDGGEHYITHRRFRVYPSLAKAAEDPTVNAAALAASVELGVPVEELDI